MKNLRLLLVGVMAVIGLMAAVPVFALEPVNNSCAGYSDVQVGDQYCPAVKYVTERGIFKGTDGQFNLFNSINRAEVLKVIMQAFYSKTESFDENNPPMGSSFSFNDIYASSRLWWYTYLKSALKKGIINGYPDKTFKAYNSVTRAEFLKMFFLSSPSKNEVINLNLDYTSMFWYDVFHNDWFARYFAFLNDNNIELPFLPSFCNSPYICPNSYMTRFEVANLMYNYHKRYGVDLGPGGGGGASLAAPVLANPINAQYFSNVQNTWVDFNWNDVGASYYDVMVRLPQTNSYFINQSVTSAQYYSNKISSNANFRYFFNIQNSTQNYYWKVRAYDNFGNYVDSNESWFGFKNVSNPSLTKPVLLTPANNQNIFYDYSKGASSSAVNFTWSSSGASYYEVYWRQVGSSYSGTPSKSYSNYYNLNFNIQPSTMSSSKTITYYWKIRAYDGFGNYQDSDEYYFNFKDPNQNSLGTPVQIGPVNGTGYYGYNPNITFSWYSTYGATKYDLMVKLSGSSTFTTFPTTSTSYYVSSNYFAPLIQNYGQSWKVRAYDAYGNFKDSPEWSFYIWKTNWDSNVLGTPVLYAPADQTVLTGNQNVNFSWYNVDGAVKYQLLVWYGGSSNYTYYNTNTNYYTVSANAFPGFNYNVSIYAHHWKVRAYDANNNYKDSEERTLYVKRP